MSRMFPVCCAIFLSSVLSAQSLIGRVPYQPAPDGNEPPTRLNPVYLARQLPPLPQVDIPASLPPELRIPAEEFEAWRQVEEAGRLRAEGSPEKALTLLKKVAGTYPDALMLQINIADLLFALDRFEEAEAAYRKALQQNPFQFQALNNLAWMYVTRPGEPFYNPQEALRLINRARMVQPNNHFIWSTLSQTYYELGQYEEARTAAQRALERLRQSNGPLQTFIRYQIQLEKCLAAVQATSILE